MGEERCVCCGAIIPEGRMVCPECERKAAENETEQPRGEDDE